MDRILKLINGLSLATIKELTSRKNGIGVVVNTKGVFNDLHKIRQTIITENVNLVLKDKTVDIRDRSFLSGVTNNDIDTNNYSDIATRLADILENELLYVRDTFIPTVNNISELIENKIAELGTTNIQNKYSIKYINRHSIMDMLYDTELNGESYAPDLSGVNYSLPNETEFSTIKSYILSGNSITDSAIEAFLGTRDDNYWLELYNTCFTLISPNNQFLMSLQTNRIPRLDDTIFLYLVARVYANKVPFIISGEPTLVKRTFNVLHRYLRTITKTNIEMLDNLTKDNILIISKKNDSITINSELMGKGEDCIDADAIIGAAIEGILYGADGIRKDKERLKAVYKNSNELYIIATNKALANNLRSIYMDILDIELPKCIDNYDRRSLSEYIYSKDVNELKVVNKMVSKVLLRTNFDIGNVEYILDRMKFYVKMFNKDNVDFSAVAEYIALELVLKYIVNIHLEIKG